MGVQQSRSESSGSASELAVNDNSSASRKNSRSGTSVAPFHALFPNGRNKIEPNKLYKRKHESIAVATGIAFAPLGLGGEIIDKVGDGEAVEEEEIISPMELREQATQTEYEEVENKCREELAESNTRDGFNLSPSPPLRSSSTNSKGSNASSSVVLRLSAATSRSTTSVLSSLTDSTESLPSTRSTSSNFRQRFLEDMPNTTVPCQYRTGRTLGSGTYAIVKEAIHIKTGKYYACKVINKKLMEGREHMVRNEIAVLKRISSGHKNIVTLHDYFETAHNLYLCFDLCTGGELFDRICAKGNYYEADAASLVRTILKAVSYIHRAGIVHRDLKPENLLFRTPDEEADIMIADFGLSRVMEGGIGGEKLSLLTEICGTPGYMAPEIFKKTGHGKPVDVWAMGVITYFLLAGYTPFDKDSQQAEMEAIIAGDYKFEPLEYWANVSETARDFVKECLTIDPAKRPTADEALQHKWLADLTPHFVPDPESPTGGPTDLLPHVKKAFNAKHLWRKAAFSIRAVNRMATLAGGHHSFHNTEAQMLSENVMKYKEESEKEVMENANILHQHEGGASPPTSPREDKEREKEKKVDDLSVDNEKLQGNLETRMAKTSLSERRN